MFRCKRAAWRFARERASAASRWSWLMANIAELEYRIRQLVDYQRQLRTNKGPITLAKHPKGISIIFLQHTAIRQNLKSKRLIVPLEKKIE